MNSDDEDMDIAKLAEEHANKKPEKRPPSQTRSLNAWMRVKARRMEDEVWRRKVKAALDNKKKSP